MSSVQPDNISLRPKNTKALCWLLRHWSQARVLKLQLDDLPTLRPGGTTDKVIWGDYELASWEARDILDHAVGLTRLLALHIGPGHLYNISPLTQLPLRHLQLELRKCVPIGGLNTLGCMTLLGTLVIHCNEDSGWFDGHPHEGDAFPKLDLQGCSSLRAVAFKMSIPEQLHVPESCFVHLESGCTLFTSSVDSALESCASCTCFVNNSKRLCQSLGHRFAALTFLEINGNFEADEDDDDGYGGDDGPLSIVLGEHFRHWRYLNILSSPSRKGVHLKIAAPMQLVSLQVLAEGPLRVDICDMDILAAALQVFHLQASEALDTIAPLKPLLMAMPKMGKIYTCTTSLQKETVLPTHGVVWMAGIEDCCEEAIGCHFNACHCSACWRCLRRAGALDRLLRN